MNNQKLSAAKQIMFSGFVILLVLLTAFILAEVYFRSQPMINLPFLTGRVEGASPTSKWADIDAFSAFKPKPGQWKAIGGKTINEHGFISTPELSVTKQPGTTRILFLGGSSTAGTGFTLDDHDTWPWKVIELLRQKSDRKIDFINGSAGGYTSFESFGRLWSRLRFFSPDIVVLYHGWNEMYYFNKVDQILSWRTLPDGSWSFKRKSKILVYEPYYIDPFISWSQLLTRLRLKLAHYMGGYLGGEATPSVSKTLDTKFDRGALDIWKTNLKLIQATCKEIGAKLFVVKQATLIVPNLPMDQRTMIRYKSHGFDHDAHLRAFDGIYKVIDE